MNLIADGLLIATALTAALYCHVLSRRLRHLTDAGSGIRGQIEALTRALDETRTALADTRRGVAEARGSARNATETLSREVQRALEVAAELSAVHKAVLADASPRPGGAAPVVAPSREPAFPPASDDDIPDWPDGVIPSPDFDARPAQSAPALRQAAGLLRVERVAL
jgi:hypothetical protein